MTATFDPERLGLLQNRILIRPDEPSAFSRGGLVIPPAYRKPSSFGTVIAMGRGMRLKDGTRWPMPDIRPGDRVVFNARNPFPVVELNGEELLMARDEAILAQIVEEP